MQCTAPMTMERMMVNGNTIDIITITLGERPLGVKWSNCDVEVWEATAAIVGEEVRADNIWVKIGMMHFVVFLWVWYIMSLVRLPEMAYVGLASEVSKNKGSPVNTQ